MIEKRRGDIDGFASVQILYWSTAARTTLWPHWSSLLISRYCVIDTHHHSHIVIPLVNIAISK